MINSYALLQVYAAEKTTSILIVPAHRHPHPPIKEITTHAFSNPFQQPANQRLLTLNQDTERYLFFDREYNKFHLSGGKYYYYKSWPFLRRIGFKPNRLDRRQPREKSARG